MNPKNIDYFRTKFFLNNVNPPRYFRLQMHFARSVKNLHVDFDFPKEGYAHIKGKK